MEGYGIVYKRIMRDSSLSPEARMIYAYLCSFAGAGSTCFPGLELMLKETQMSKTRFYKHLQILVDAGIVSKQQERNGQRLGRTIYKINHRNITLFPNFKETEGCQLPNSEVPNFVVPSFEESQNEEYINNSLKSNSVIKNNSLKNIHEQICNLLNEGKRKARSKGRIKPSGAKWCVSGLEAKGMSKNDILKAAQEVAGAGMDLDWFSFSEYCLKR